MAKISNKPKPKKRMNKNLKAELFRKRIKEAHRNSNNAPRIGKPQKSKKHKKLKVVDPFYRGERKDQLLKVFNQKPTSLEQEVPRKSLEILQMAEQMSHIKKPKKKRKEVQSANAVEDKRVFSDPNEESRTTRNNLLQKKPGESDKRFLFRLNQESRKALMMAKLADKWDTDIVENEDGQIELKKNKAPSEKKKRRAAEKRERKKQKEEEKLIDQYQDFKGFEDHVEFGEVVHAPPTLSSLPRKAEKVAGGRKPGAKSLILKDMLLSKNTNSSSQMSSGKRQIGQTLKKKMMSPAQQVRLEAERERVIDIYRKMKEEKLNKT